MKRVYIYICMLLFAVFLLSTAFGQADGPTEGELPTEYVLNFLLAEEDGDIDAEIHRLSGELEESGPHTSGESHIQSKAGNHRKARIRYSLGVLHIYRHIRTKREDDAYRALELLKEAESGFGESELFQVHLGMAYSFIAEIRRAFGLSQLKQMHSILTSIPADHPDWLVRFLRGTTLFEVGTELPGIFLVRTIKRESLALGRADLEYIIRRYSSSSDSTSPRSSYSPDTYNFEEKPVPAEIAEQARTMLQKTDG